MEEMQTMLAVCWIHLDAYKISVLYAWGLVDGYCEHDNDILVCLKGGPISNEVSETGGSN